jgi:hypothetical protein
LASAAWLTSGSFKSLCAEAIWQRPIMARQRAKGLSVIVFIVVALTLLGFSIVRYQKNRAKQNDSVFGVIR